MQAFSMITKSGIIFSTAGSLTTVSGMVGRYSRMGDKESWEYFDNIIEISEEQKIAFEGEVRAIIYEVSKLGEKF
ncbi:putative coil containing protein [Vibrio phage 424E50-1]|nr:putative coil containing protein [Vibrio phage 424E50-1]